MIITICGSSMFYKEMAEFKKKLLEQGHEPLLHPFYLEVADGRMQEFLKPWQKGGIEHTEAKKKYDFIRTYHGFIKMSDAILVLNFDKKGIKSYIGGNTLMDIGFAYIYNKKIFLLNPVPEVSYKDEIEAMRPIILNGDLSKIQESEKL